MSLRRWCVALSRMLMVLVAVLLPILAVQAPAGAAPRPEKVTVGAFIHDVQEVDLESGSFVLDFYLWFRWRNPTVDPTDSIEVMNSNGMENTTTSATGGVTGKPLYPEPRIMPDGSRYMAYRYQGVFSRKMDLAKFPFDAQDLLVYFEDQDQDTRFLEFVPDATPVAISPTVTIPGYEIGTPRLTVAQHRYPTNFGDLSAPGETEYSRITLELPVTRDVLPYLVKIMLPIMIVILITSLIYVLPGRFEEARTGIGVTAMLTMVALQWSTDSDLPSVEYLTMLDLVYILSMLYILVAMGYAVFASRRSRKDAAEAHLTKLDRRVGVISLVVYVVLIATTMVSYL
jgi:hypothetical protein